MSKILNHGKASKATQDRLVGGFNLDGVLDPNGRYGKEEPIPDTTCYTNDVGTGTEVAVSPSIY